MIHLADWRKPKLVALRPPEWALGASEAQSVWRGLNFLEEPNWQEAKREFDAFAALLAAGGCELRILEYTGGLSPDAVYLRDCVCLTPKGVAGCNMTKANRRSEPQDAIGQLSAAGIAVAGKIEPPGFLEGGDIVWVRDDHCFAGLSHRSNEEGVRQFQAICGDGIRVDMFDIANERGKDHVFHLSSIISMVAGDLCLAHMQFVPVSLLRSMEKLGVRMVEMHEDEAMTLAANVLVVDSGTVAIVAGNARTSARLQAAGLKTIPFVADNLCILGQGGPTCLTRPLAFR